MTRYLCPTCRDTGRVTDQNAQNRLTYVRIPCPDCFDRAAEAQLQADHMAAEAEARDYADMRMGQ